MIALLLCAAALAADPLLTPGDPLAPGPALAPPPAPLAPLPEDLPPEAPPADGAPPGVKWHPGFDAVPEGVLYDQALRAIDQRELDGALARLEALLRRDDSARVHFQLGRVHELQERYPEALAAYAAAAARAPEGPLARDVPFRRALVHDELGQHAEAQALLRGALAAEGAALPADARAVLELELAISALRAGGGAKARAKKKAAKQLQRALGALEALNTQPWMQARAQHALLAAVLREAYSVPITADRRAAKHLELRASALKVAEDQVATIGRLNEIEYILWGLRDLSDGYLRLHDDMLAAPAPEGLSPEALAHYEAELARRVEVLERKALGFCDLGLDLAVKRGWVGAARDQLQARRDALQAKVEGG
jgi:tetratricopeptide (TPR) repeat protein